MTLTHRWLLISILLAAFLVVPLEANAHSPIFNDLGSPSLAEAFRIEDVEVSKAVMGAIRSSETVDYYQIDLPEGDLLQVSVFVPIACEGFYPEIALIGPEKDTRPPSVQLEVPTGYLASEFQLPESEWGTFFEPFDPAFYHAGPKISITGNGRAQYLAIYSAEKATGAYMLGTSGAERWQPDENWRERKAAYDQCEIGQSNWLLGNWRDLLIGFGAVGMVTLTGGFFIRRARATRNP